MKSRFFFTALLTLLSLRLALATDRYYSDFTSSSPNGKLEAVASSEDNKREGRHRAFAENFTIVLRDKASGREIWSWKQGESDGSPVELILTDEGSAIERDAWDRYFHFDPGGKRTESLRAFDVIPESEIKLFADQTTAGTHWRMYSKSGIREDSGQSYYYIRTYWGRYLVIDMVTGKSVQDPLLEGRIESALVDEVKAWITSFDGVFVGVCARCGESHLTDQIKDNCFLILKNSIPGGEDIVLKAIQRKDKHNGDFTRYLVKIRPRLDPLGFRSLPGSRFSWVGAGKILVLAGFVLIGCYVVRALVLRRRLVRGGPCRPGQ